MDWKGNDQVFRGYLKGNPEGDGKAPAKGSKIKGVKTFPSFDEVCDSESFGGILQDGVIDISFDTEELSDMFWNMADENDWNTLIIENPKNHHIHSFWNIPQNWEAKDGKDKKLAVGLIADIHSGSTYIPLRVHGDDRFPPLFAPERLQDVPPELFPVNTQIDLLNLSEGQGRNEELFKYILILQSQLLLDKESIRSVLSNVNRFVFKEPLDSSELETITRDEAFEKPVFYNGKVFMHDAFGRYIQNEFHIKRINGQLHVYDGGIYKSGYRYFENKMVQMIPNLKSTNRTEVLKYLEIMTPEETWETNENLIAFRNGIFDMKTKELLPFSPDYVITNMIPWDYNPNAYDELCDHTLNKIACNDPAIRSLLEECIGYCFFRKNEMSKSFFLTGSGSNGKSTFLDMLRNVLGRQNYVSLDMDELDERFSTASMFGKLANIGDDISDEFLQGKSIAQFKKIVSGNDIKAENKGQDAFFFKPTVKLLFSANELPRMRNKGFFAIKRRLVIIPFNAVFSKTDPDYDSQIVWKLKTQEVAEYLIRLGLEGLQRVLTHDGFTESEKVTKEVDQFELENNPILLFMNEIEPEEILNHEVKEVFTRYDVFCYENGFQKATIQTFVKEVKNRLNCEKKQIRMNGRRMFVFKKGESENERT